MKKMIFIGLLVLATMSFGQKNEIGINPLHFISGLGMSYERFATTHFSFGVAGTVGLFRFQNQKTNYMVLPFVRYYFKNDFRGFFIHGGYYTDEVKQLQESGWLFGHPKRKVHHSGPLIGAGGKILLGKNFAVNLYLAAGPDLNEVELVPIVMDGIATLTYRF